MLGAVDHGMQVSVGKKISCGGTLKYRKIGARKGGSHFHLEALPVLYVLHHLNSLANTDEVIV